MKEAVAKALLEIGAVGFSPENPIRFKSGIISPVYVDNRRLPYHPQQWQVVIEGFQEKIKSENISFEIIAGVAMGGVPHSAVLGFVMKKPSVFVRKEAKEHGKGQRIEGGEIKAKRVLLLEDLVTTGGSSLSGVQALRDEGAIVNTLLAIVSYGFQEANDNFSAANVHLETLTDFASILQVALEMEKFAQVEHEIIDDWFKDPHGWAARHNKL